ncbi:MAG: APC family permease [Sphingomicrobium sp.]
MNNNGAPVRAIGIGGAILIAANGMVASGIFSLPGKLDAAVGMFAPVLLLLAGLGFVCIALSYADCARHFESSGGPILYVGTAFGRFPGFIIGWLNYISRAAAQGANANVVVLTAVALFPAAAGSAARQAMLITLFVALTTLNVLGVRRAIAALAGITALKLIPLLLLMIAAFITFGAGHAPVIPPVPDAAGVALVALYAFTGFEVASLAAGETSNPRRALPIALVGTVMAIGLLYVLVQWAYSASGTPNGDAPLVALAVRIGGAAAGFALGLTVLVSVVGGITVAILGGSRMTVGMAEEKMLPARFASFSPRFATPVFSILFFGVFALLLAVSGSFVFLAVVSTLARLLSYLACILAAPRLDRQFAAHRAWPRRLLFPGIAITLCIWAASQSKASEWRSLALLTAAGAILYLIAARSVRWPRSSPPPTA